MNKKPKYNSNILNTKLYEKAKQKADKGNLFWENWYRVYGLGLVGSLQGAIYTNWTTGEFKEITKEKYYKYI